MPLIGFDAILSMLHVGDSFKRRNDPQYWSGWISDDGPTRKVKVTAVEMDETGLDLTVVDGDTTYELKAVPSDASHTKVLLDGNVVEGASLVFAPKFSFGNPSRWAFDFRPVPLHGNQARFNIRYDP